MTSTKGEPLLLPCLLVAGGVRQRPHRHEFGHHGEVPPLRRAAIRHPAPGQAAHFTDKLRANSGMLCDASFPRMIRHFDFDGTDAAMPGLCEDLLNFLQDYCAEFLAMVEETYGDLDGYYIANRETMPRLAGLAFLDRGDAAGAAECFSQPNMDGENSTWWVRVETGRTAAKGPCQRHLSVRVPGVHRRPPPPQGPVLGLRHSAEKRPGMDAGPGDVRPAARGKARGRARPLNPGTKGGVQTAGGMVY